MHCHYGTNNRAPRWTFTDPCKPEVRPGARQYNFKNKHMTSIYKILVVAFMRIITEYTNKLLKILCCLVFISLKSK